jgi:hypothetical protein
MRGVLSLALLSTAFTLPAWTAAFTITFDETTGNPTTPAGLVGRLQSGNLVLCDAFNAGTSICTGSNISDLVQWAGGSISFFRSNLEPGQSPVAGTAELGIPAFDPSFGAGTVYLLEPAALPEVINYTPTQGANATPGGIIAPVMGDTVTYVITSDAATGEPIPEPSMLFVLGIVLAALGLVRKRRNAKLHF